MKISFGFLLLIFTLICLFTSLIALTPFNTCGQILIRLIILISTLHLLSLTASLLTARSFTYTFLSHFSRLHCCVWKALVHRILVTPTFPMRAPSPCQVSLYLSSSAVHIFTNSHPACYPILPSIILATCHMHFPLFSISSSIQTPLLLQLLPLQFWWNALPFIFSYVLCFLSPLIPSVLDS